MDKLQLLKELKKDITLNCYGTDKLSSDNTYIFVANHNCLLDVFYLPMSLDFPIVEMISGRLIFNREDMDRFNLINNYLYSMPIEAHGGAKYSNLCLSTGVELLKNGVSLSIFPEGAYIPEKVVHKGRTGATRMLFDALHEDISVLFVPVAIDVKGNYDLDSYDFTSSSVDVHFLDAIECDNYLDAYVYSDDFAVMNDALHKPIDMAMKSISDCLNRPFDFEYIPLRPKGNIMNFDGEKIPISQLENTDYLKYEQDLSLRLKKQLSTLNK